ncbi:RNA polymerase sigma-70 factor [Butyricimonas synergistica]|uniref:RNA polymerase sigma-70 factor n=1 Tax=Butyricimonas synergistica TaxID=544644 RepID=UPI0003629EE0|nr:RNA polymerase sigma-70 factor [Butyricimonas synergistica]
MAESVNRKIQEYRFEQIFKEFSKPMFLYALSFVTAEEEAEDVVQEVFVNFWKDKTYQKVRNEVMKTYLFRSVKNNCLNRLKKKDVQRGRLDLLREEVVEEEMMKLNDALIQEVESEIDRLPEQTREIIRGVFFREMKYQEVADLLGISINTVKTLLKNGIKHLRERFAERMDLFLIIMLIK